MSSTDQMSEVASLVRVSVVSDKRRADLALPGGVPVAELMPEIVREVGLLASDTAHGGFRLVAQDGRVVIGDVGLTAQSIDSGHVLSVTALSSEEHHRVYDDIVEAMSDAVEKDLRPWDPAAGRTTALTASVLLLLLGALTVALQRPSAIAGAAAGVVALVLIGGSVVLARVQKEPQVSVVLAWMAVVMAVVCGITVAPAGDLLGTPVALGSVGAVIIGLVAIFGLVEHRHFLIPAVAVGAVFAVSSALLALTDLDPESVYAVALAVVVIAGSALPWMSVGATSTRVPQAHSVTDIQADPEPIDPEQVRADAKIGHEMLLGVTATVGLMLVLVSPMLVTLGIAGALVGVFAAAILMLRTRQYRSGSEVLTGLVAGVVGLLAMALAVAVVQPDWRPGLAAVSAVAGVVLMLSTLLPSAPSVRRGRWGDFAEGVALVGLLPLLVVAIGVIGMVRS